MAEQRKTDRLPGDPAFKAIFSETRMIADALRGEPADLPLGDTQRPEALDGPHDAERPDREAGAHGRSQGASRRH